MKKRIITLIIAICFAFGCLPLFTGCTDNPGNSSGGVFVDSDELKIKNVTITSKPNKTDYFEYDYFSPDGLIFDAVVDVDGEEVVLEDLTLFDLEGTYTTEGEALTTDVKKITFTVFGYSFDIDITVTKSNFDKIEIRKRDNGTNTVAKSSIFDEMYDVTLSSDSNETEKKTLTAGEYKLYVKNGEVFVEADNQTVFEKVGQTEVKATWGRLEKILVVNVVNGYEIMCSDMIKTEDIKPTHKNFLENTKIADGTYGKMRVCNDNGYRYAGYINNVGKELKFHIYSEVEAEAELNLYASSVLIDKYTKGGTITEGNKLKTEPTIMKEQQFNTLFKASFEGNTIEISDSVLLPGFVSQKTTVDPNYNVGLDDEGRAYDPACWTQWQPVNFGKIKLKKGDNIVTLTVVKGGTFNLYKLAVSFVA